MSGFRAINRPLDGPLKLAPQEPPLCSTVSRQQCEMNQGQTSTRPSVIVPLPDKQRVGHLGHKSDLRQAVGKTKRPQKQRKKKRSSASNPTRQQAFREAKCVHSIEMSSQKMASSPTTGYCTDGAEDSDFVPCKADQAELSLSSTSNTTPRRSPRKHASRCLNTRISPQAASSFAISKRESPPTLEPMLRARPPSPSMWSSPLREKRYEEDGIVELPKLEFEYKQSEKYMRQQLALKKEAIMAEKRREKGKSAEQRSVQSYDPKPKVEKRKAKENLEQNTPRKRQRSQKSQQPGLEDFSVTYDDNVSSEVPQTGEQTDAQWSPKGRTTDEQAQRRDALLIQVEDRSDILDTHFKSGMKVRSEGSKNKKVQRLSETGTGAQDCQMHAERLGQSIGLASRDHGRQQRPYNEKWHAQFKRREVFIPERSQSCSCSMLPEYFTSNPKRIPSLETWQGQGGKLEFLEHVKQIYSCQGSIHPKYVVEACRSILAKNDYPKRWNIDFGESSFEYSQRVLFMDSGEDTNLRRAQSSIPPPIFYGHGSKRQPDPNVGSSSRSVPQPPKGVSNGCSPSLSLPVQNRRQIATNQGATTVDQPSDRAMFKSSCNYLTPPNSSQLGQRRRPVDNSDVDENISVGQISKPMPETHNGLDRSQFSFITHRQRHQSVPANFSSRRSMDEPNLPAPQPRSIPLQELTSNALFYNMNRTMTSIASLAETLRNLVPTAAASAHFTANHPAPAPPPPPPPAPPATVNAQADENRNEPPPAASRTKKKPSYAERQRKQRKLDRHVAAHLRLSDEGIIEIGRIVSGYERHRRAPYAFGWSGGLYAEYKHLLVLNVNGVPVWTPEEIRRVRG